VSKLLERLEAGNLISSDVYFRKEERVMRGVKLSLRKSPREYQSPGEHAMYMSGRANPARPMQKDCLQTPPNALINALIQVLSHSTE
jgi:hypothetical protein